MLKSRTKEGNTNTIQSTLTSKLVSPLTLMNTRFPSISDILFLILLQNKMSLY